MHESLEIVSKEGGEILVIKPCVLISRRNAKKVDAGQFQAAANCHKLG
jgi:hypothetical protein